MSTTLAPTALPAWRLPRWSASILVGAAFLALWEWTTRTFAISTAVLMQPSTIAETLADRWDILMQHTAITAVETAEGFVLAALLGMGLAGLLSTSRLVRITLMPYLTTLQIVPKIALAPLFTIWLGTGMPCRLVFAVFFAFFPVAISSLTGLLSADRNALRLCASLRASRLQEILLIRLPYALPHVFAGLKVAATMVLLGVVIGEFVTAQAGLGYIVLFASSIGETALVFAALFLLCAIGLVLYGLVLLAERAYGRWFGAAFPDTQ